MPEVGQDLEPEVHQNPQLLNLGRTKLAERGGNQRLCVENAEWLSLCQFSYGCLKGGSCSHIPAPVPSGIDVAQKVKSQVNESAAAAPGHKCFFSPSSNLSI